MCSSLLQLTDKSLDLSEDKQIYQMTPLFTQNDDFFFTSGQLLDHYEWQYWSFLGFAQLVTIVKIFSDWDKSCDSTVNWSRLAQWFQLLLSNPHSRQNPYVLSKCLKCLCTLYLKNRKVETYLIWKFMHESISEWWENPCRMLSSPWYFLRFEIP